MKKKYIILNETKLTSRDESKLNIPQWFRPTTVHKNREEAIAELMRLREKHPKERFGMYESAITFSGDNLVAVK